MEKEFNRIKVAIRCITYNHEPYISQCLDGLMMQRTCFRFIAIVHDDCSSDRTADIIREYAQKYPSKIVPIFESENQFSQGKLKKIMDEAIDKLGPEYIALCEGDDYWTDPYKLQKQVDYLEEHPEHVICAHNSYQQFENNSWRIFVNPNYREHDIDIKEMLTKWHIPTASLVYRKAAYDKVPATSSYPNGDYYLMLRLLSQGKFHYDPAVMSVYRMHSDSISANMKKNEVKMYDDIIHLLNGVRSLYNDEYQTLFDKAIYNYEEMRLDIVRSTDSWKKWFYKKTYTRAIKKIMKIGNQS